jgi:5'-nucleotidase
MVIVVTNDDGINAPGIRALADALAPMGRVVVAAPDRERSAASHSLTLHHPLRMEEVSTDRFAVDGTPTDCIHLAVHTILEGNKPDLLVSGINRGANLGQNVTYSGTVWGALEGNLMGIPSFAISLVEYGHEDYGPAASFAHRVAGWIGKYGIPEDTVLNINVPDDPSQDLDRFLITHQGCARFEESVIEKEDPRGRKYFWIGGEQLPPEGGIETDVGAIREGYISVTPLHADMTNYRSMDIMRQWENNS